jgi:hypothetical protein
LHCSHLEFELEKPGAKNFISAANKKEDGTLEAAAISVGRDGITPPM